MVKENLAFPPGLCFDMAGNFPEKVFLFDKTRIMDRHFFKFQTQKVNGLALVEIPKYIMILTPTIASLPVLATEGKDKQVRTAHKIAPTFLPFTNITSETRIDQIIDSLRAIQAIDVNRFTDSKTFNNSLEWTTDYIKKFADHEDRELRLAFQLGGRIIDEDNKIFQNYQQNIAQDSIWNRDDGLPLN